MWNKVLVILVIVGFLLAVIMGGIAFKTDQKCKQEEVIWKGETVKLNLEHKVELQEKEKWLLIAKVSNTANNIVIATQKKEHNILLKKFNTLNKNYSIVLGDYNAYKNQWEVDDTNINISLMRSFMPYCISVEFFEGSIMRMHISDKKLLINALDNLKK